jgi:hypothetical protein
MNIKANNSKDLLNYIKEIESTDSSFCKIGDSAETLIVSFGHIVHGGFASKTSLVNKKCENNNFDILYIRDVEKNFYLDALPKIGNSLAETINFLESATSKYKTTIYIGSSMGGYASILFASILKGTTVIAQMPQTDLEYVYNHCIHIFKPIKNKYPDVWNSYKNLNSVINNSTQYIVGGFNPNANVLHDLHHYKNIKSHANVKRPNYFDFVKEVKTHIA